jgi:GNAT superfamily N-acetyltransferase
VQTELAIQTSAQNLGLYTIRRLGLDDLEVLANLESRASDYSVFMTGIAPQIEDVRALFETHHYDQIFVFGVFLEHQLVGVLQVFNLEIHTDVLGLLLIDPAHRQTGLGTRVFETYRNWAANRGVKQIFLTIPLENTVFRFWFHLGFEPTSSDPIAVSFGLKTQVMQEMRLELLNDLNSG